MFISFFKDEKNLFIFADEGGSPLDIKSILVVIDPILLYALFSILLKSSSISSLAMKLPLFIFSINSERAVAT